VLAAATTPRSRDPSTAIGFPDDGKRVVPDLAVGTQIIRPYEISRIDLAAIDELVDLDGPRRF